MDVNPPSYVMETLALGPKNAVLDKFNAHDTLAELYMLLNHCKANGVSDETITDINVKTLTYIKKCKQLKPSRNLIMTKKYLTEKKLVAVPFDKGIGICIMKQEMYQKKLDVILNLPQFEKVTQTRKNAKNAVLKEEERIVSTLKQLRNDGKINEYLFEKLKPIGSQPARIYGLAKIHKQSVPVRPVLSMPGSSYHPVGIQIAEWLSNVPECQINTSTKEIADHLKEVTLEEDEEIVSFDVASLYTNVPVAEAIEYCADLLYNNNNQKDIPSVDKDTFVILAKLACCDVIMSTHNGYYRQTDGLAMGSPPAPHLANGWLSKYDPIIKADACLYARYMDDILQNMKVRLIDEKLEEINNLHPSLTFTIERENDSSIPFLDMSIINEGGNLSSTWYNKPTDTGLIMNFHALAPKRYKRSVVSGFVHRIHRACSEWGHFHNSLQRAKKILEANQYPPAFYEPIIHATLSAIFSPQEETSTLTQQQHPLATQETTVPQPSPEETTSTMQKHKLFVQYRGKCTEDYAQALHRANAPCTVVMTLRKLKTMLPSLKPPVEKTLRSGVVYKLSCPRCQSCYVGQTIRHLRTRFSEHQTPSAAVAKHLSCCQTTLTCQETEILASTRRGQVFLMTLEVIWIRELSPSLNTKDEYRSRELTIRW